MERVFDLELVLAEVRRALEAGQVDEAVRVLSDQRPVDMVDVFRRSEFLDEIIRSAVALKDEKSLRAIWLQLGLTHPVAEAFARARGLDVISDRCPKIELKRERITT